MNSEEFFKRTKDILNPASLRGVRATVFGVGSGGGRVADELARIGTGNIVLVDRPGETFLEHNIVRHILGYSALGRLKVEAMREHLLDINPECRVQAVSLDVVKEPEQVQALVNESAVVFLCTDNEPSKHAVNAASVRAAVPMVFAGVFDGGCGGEVGRVMPCQACYACMSGFLRRANAFDEYEEPSFDYSNPGNEQYQSTAALNMDIAQIALIQARVGLITMLETVGADVSEYGPLGGNYILFGNRPVKGLFHQMWHCETWTINRDSGCMVCGLDNLDDTVADRLANDILAQAGRQTP